MAETRTRPTGASGTEYIASKASGATLLLGGGLCAVGLLFITLAFAGFSGTAFVVGCIAVVSSLPFLVLSYFLLRAADRLASAGDRRTS